MDSIESVMRELKSDEGFVPHAYQDSEGYWTIGYGCLIDKRRGGGITMQEAERLLRNRVLKVVRELNQHLPWMQSLDEQRQGVLINMAYQMGVGGLLAFKKTLAAIKDGDYEEAAEEMLRSRWAIQTPRRAMKLSRMMNPNQVTHGA